MPRLAVWFIFAVVAAATVFAIRLGVPIVLGARNQMTWFDASIRGAFVLLAFAGVWLWARRQTL
jgi:hypothetical protein